MAGERYRHWEPGTAGRGERIVCGLCEREAVRSGWVRSAREAQRESSVGLRGTVRQVA